MEDKDIIKETEIEDSIKEDRRWCVYIHRNVHNDKRYIGITSQLPEERWGHNGCKYLSKSRGKYKHPAFANALLKYNDWQNDWEHIIFANNIAKPEADAIEKLLISLYNTTDNKFGYNLTFGGEGNIPNEETKRKLSESHKGKPSSRKGVTLTQETKDKISKNRKGKYTGPENNFFNNGRSGKDNPFYGKKHTEESRKKISEKAKGRVAHNKGVPMSDEQKEKISLSLRGNIIPEYTRQRVRETHMGIPRTNLTKQKISAAKKGKFTGINSKNIKPVYSIELHEIFWGAKAAQQKYQISNNTICEVCMGSLIKKTAGKHPETGEKLHWLYAEDAIEQGYITQQELDDYLNNLREKEKGDKDNGKTV